MVPVQPCAGSRQQRDCLVATFAVLWFLGVVPGPQHHVEGRRMETVVFGINWGTPFEEQLDDVNVRAPSGPMQAGLTFVVARCRIDGPVQKELCGVQTAVAAGVEERRPDLFWTRFRAGGRRFLRKSSAARRGGPLRPHFPDPRALQDPRGTGRRPAVHWQCSREPRIGDCRPPTGAGDLHPDPGGSAGELFARRPSPDARSSRRGRGWCSRRRRRRTARRHRHPRPGGDW